MDDIPPSQNELNIILRYITRRKHVIFYVHDYAFLCILIIYKNTIRFIKKEGVVF